MSAEHIWSPAGLDLAHPDVTTVAEWEAFRADQRRAVGYTLGTPELMGEFRPDVYKRFLAQSAAGSTPESFGTHLRFLHYYAIIAHRDGVLYEMKLVEAAGHSRADVVETLALATWHSPSYGLHYMSASVAEALRSYADPEQPLSWPAGWRADPQALESGLDFSVPHMQDGELELVRAWYVRVAGEVPQHVTFLAEYRPALLKAYRNRFENTLRELPTQMLPYLLLHLETVRGNEDGIRDAALLARGLGVAKVHAVDAVANAFNYAGAGGLAAVNRAAGDVFAAW